VVDSVRSIARPTPKGDCVSLAVVSHGEYGAPGGLVFGFPVRAGAKGWSVVEGLAHSDFARQRIAASTAELESEREAVSHLLG
jgi:malate dehydrogenase